METPKLLNLNSEWKQVRPLCYFQNDVAILHGYQNFELTKNFITPKNNDLIIKDSIIRAQLEKYITKETDFLDLGCANLYFGFLANILGAKSVTGVEIDKEYVSTIDKVIKDFTLENVSMVESNVQDYNIPADVVNAAAIIHWIYSCSACMGSMEKIVKYFSDITRKVLIIEWIDNEDAAIQYFGHINYNNSHTENDYNKENFLKHMNKEFKEVTFLAKTEPTREIYVAIK